MNNINSDARHWTLYPVPHESNSYHHIPSHQYCLPSSISVLQTVAQHAVSVLIFCVICHSFTLFVVNTGMQLISLYSWLSSGLWHFTRNCPDRSSKYLWNIHELLLDSMVVQPRKQLSSYLLPWKLQIPQFSYKQNSCLRAFSIWVLKTNFVWSNDIYVWALFFYLFFSFVDHIILSRWVKTVKKGLLQNVKCNFWVYGRIELSNMVIHILATAPKFKHHICLKKSEDTASSQLSALSFLSLSSWEFLDKLYLCVLPVGPSVYWLVPSLCLFW